MPQTRKRNCFDDLRARILNLELAPGADLDEASLCAHYAMSRTPMREVLQRLAGSGYVTIADNRGAKIASMDISVMRVFFQTAPMIYANIARLAAENGTDAQLSQLREVQEAFRQSGPEQAATFNHQFHEVIGDMADNHYLRASLTRLLIDHTRLGQTFYRPGTEAEMDLVRRAITDHDRMIAALEARDGDAMVRLTLEHWTLSQDTMERFVRPDPLPVDIRAKTHLAKKGRARAV